MSKLLKKGLLILGLMIACAALGNTGKTPVAKAGSYTHRGVWVAFYEFYKAGLSNRTEAAFRQNADKMFQKIKDYGCNEVFFHVRAFDDAIYPSKIVGWSKYISTDGKALPYDPLKILVELAHAKKLKLHAWMNPYRVTTSKILNPAKKSTLKRINSQVKEILDNYDVDGIHFDDYFYLGDEYNHVKPATRRKKVNKMVKMVHDTVKAKSEDIEFGISPAGNYEYCMQIGADVKTWLSTPGYIDYIIPQIYWSNKYKMNGKMTALYTERLELWQGLNKIDLPMYIGLGLYRAGKGGAPDYGWKSSDENLAEQARMLKAGNCEGYTLFAYTDIDSDEAETEMENFIEEIAWIKLKKSKATVAPGESIQLEPTWMPAMYEGDDDFEFESADESIATVGETGLVTAVADYGTVKIYVTGNGKKKTFTLTIGNGGIILE